MKKITDEAGQVKLINLEPGHFHAALMQKKALPLINDTVFVYTSGGPELNNYLENIEGYNTRSNHPTRWNEIIYEGKDFLEKMLDEKKGNVVLISGNNQHKTEFIYASVKEGLHVLADKPMAIDVEDFKLLEKSFDVAAKKDVLLYDIMTERFEITTILQKELSEYPAVFGELIDGTPEKPAVTKESVHHFFKYVSGKEIVRPGWFFDVKQQGEGIVDVTTHLVDLVQWECFPETVLDYTTDVELISSYRWPTLLTPEQFSRVTLMDTYPGYLKPYLIDGATLGVYANGEINFKMKGKHAKIVVKWNYEAPEGRDTHYSIMRGTKANLIIRQGKEEDYEPVLYVEPIADKSSVEKNMIDTFEELQRKYPGLALQETNAGWKLAIPDRYKVGHEAHFGQVTESYLDFLLNGELPSWEVSNMLTKYYITTHALQMAKDMNPEKQS